MPYVFGENVRRDFTNKRRKLSPVPGQSFTMARYHDEDMADEQWRFEQHTNVEAEKSEEKNKSRPSETEYSAEVVRTTSREELMECIKRGQRPTWVPQTSFQALQEEEEALNAQRRLKSASDPSRQPVNLSSIAVSDSQTSAGLVTSSLRSPTFTTDIRDVALQPPPSAFHRGDFSDDSSSPNQQSGFDTLIQPGLAISTLGEVNDSIPSCLSRTPRPNSLDAHNNVRALSQLNTFVANRRRAPSLGSSLSSSFVMRVPTSPLVHATTNPYLDLPALSVATEDTPPPRDLTRRRTMPPNSFHSFTMTPIDQQPPNFSRPFIPTIRREASLPSPSHQPRRSLSSFTYCPRSNPPTPLPRTRRLSMTLDGASRPRASMVGSFEESILRGRMSTPPSKPLDFVAQIGVMGRGDCPSNLTCPAHVSVSFPAVFYSYPASTGMRSVADDTPSPYVGTIDLDHNLKPITLATRQSKRSLSSHKQLDAHPDISLVEKGQEPSLETPKLHIGGAYRVPQQGQLQIIIKNPNKTAVKLFLVPYDLSGMEPSTKTFVRQRSFSTGSIIEKAVGQDTSRQPIVDPLENKHILRYLIHVKFCCPAKNRFYLYDNIRVVFANRVPDGKEKLRNEVQLPEPKFSVWKTTKPQGASKAHTNAPTTPTLTAFEFDSPQFFGEMDGFGRDSSPTTPTPPDRPVFLNHSPPAFDFPLHSLKIKGALQQSGDHALSSSTSAFGFPDLKTPQTPSDPTKPEKSISPITGFCPTTPIRGSPIPWRSPPSTNVSTRSFSPVLLEVGDGLLSRQFKELNGRGRRTDKHMKQELLVAQQGTSPSLTSPTSPQRVPNTNGVGEDIKYTIP